jgi:hypothetical protein
MRKIVKIDAASLKALELRAADRTVGLQDLADEAIGDLLRKHRLPVTTKEMFAQSSEGSRRKPKAA